MIRSAPAFALAALLLSSAPASAQPASAKQVVHVVMISIDGLMPASYLRPDELGLKVPNLRRLASEGAYASGVVGVLPAVTYPSHTTLITGVPPAVHGVLGNTLVDPLAESNDAWYWYANAVGVPTLVSAVRAAGGTVGSVFWPVTVGLAADWLVPEYWRTGSMHDSDIELLRALSTPGLLAEVEKERAAPFGNPLSDADRTDLALAILRHHRPTLLLLHLGGVDHEEHTFGPDTPEARAAIEEADRNLGRLQGALEESGLAGSTLLVVVSDHGFQTAKRLIRPNALLVENGLLELDGKGNATSWKAWFLSHGGSASLYLADPEDRVTREKVRALLAAKFAEPGSGVGAILDKAEIAELGGDPRAELFFEAIDGFSISRTPTGGWFGEPKDLGYHGGDPRRSELWASLVLRSPALAERGDLGVVPMTAIAPTLADYLDVYLAPGADTPLPIFERAVATAGGKR